MAKLGFTATVGRRRVSARSPGTAQYLNSARRDMQNIIRRYQRLVSTLEAITPAILMDALEPTFAKSQEYCPKDTGTLAKSGYLQVTEFRGDPRVEIGYGLGGHPEYAATVHENLEWRHKAPTRAKWLQVALEEDEHDIQSRIIDGYRKLFR